MAKTTRNHIATFRGDIHLVSVQAASGRAVYQLVTGGIVLNESHHLRDAVRHAAAYAAGDLDEDPSALS